MDAGGACRIASPDGGSVAARLDRAVDARAACTFAHGAGAGMHHAFMAAFAGTLVGRGITVLRFQFPFQEAGGKRPDAPAVAQATVRAAVAFLQEACGDLPLFAAGKSFGGRMTSQAQAALPLAGVRGLVFVGFPLHPAKRPGTARAAHLEAVACPMLFLQGTRDDLADLTLMRPIVAALGPRATLIEMADADHAFHVRKSSGSDDATVMARMGDHAATWMQDRS